jgi:hypothetical protein
MNTGNEYLECSGNAYFPDDCYCGDGLCNANEWTEGTCPEDCRADAINPDDGYSASMISDAGIFMKMEREGVYYMNVLHNLRLLGSNNSREWLLLGNTTDTTMTIINVGDSEWSFGVTARNLGMSSDMTIVDGCQGVSPVKDPP